MKKIKRNRRHWAFILMTALFFLHGAAGAAETEGGVTPVDVYYLAKSIDDSLVSMYGLTYEFSKKKLSSNIRPRNSYQKLLSLADEFNLLHGNPLSKSRLEEARQVDVVNTKPRDLYNVLSLIREHLASRGAFMEHIGVRTSKTPSDVTQMLRQISYHHIEIAKQKNIATNWSTASQVYEAIVRDILPVVLTVARESEFEYEPFEFPEQPVKDILPRNITSLIQHIFNNISGYYVGKGGYDPLVLIRVNECDDIEPGDSFDLIKAVSAEFKAVSGKRTLDPETASNYALWKERKAEIVPGDVFRLLQYNYILSKRIRQIQRNS